MRLCQILFALCLAPTLALATPLTDDLARWETLQKAESPSAAAVADLARRHADWPGLSTMAGKIETNRSFEGLPAADVTAIFVQRRPKTFAGIDAFITSLGQSPQAATELRTIWREETLDESTQKQILQKYASWLQAEDHDARLDLLLDNNHAVQAGDLAKHLGPNAQAYALVRIGILQGEVQVPEALPALYQTTPQILADFVKRYAKAEQDQQGLAVLARLGPLNAKMAEELWKSRHMIARNELEAGRPQVAYSVLDQHGLSSGSDYAAAKFLEGFIALKYLRNPQMALTHFSAMHQNVTGAVSKSRAAYWAGRAAEAMSDKVQASRWYNEAAGYPTTYFGQKALEKLGQPLRQALLRQNASQSMPSLSSSDSRLQAARLYYQNGKPGYGRQFMLAAMKSAKGEGDYAVLSDLASQYDDRAALVKLARDAGKNGFAATIAGFPRLSQAEAAQARASGMSNVAFVHAIIRQESEFDESAMSGAGARGLMQLMPATAKQTAQKAGVSHETDWLTSRPDHNIRLGSAYLKQLLDRYNGSRVLAVAAYNAGPGRVSQWIQRFGDPRTNQIAVEDWIELIPIYETRNYIQRVLEGEAVYQAIL